MEVAITKENFEGFRFGDKPLVVDFWASWCGPCRSLNPIITRLAEKYEGKIVVGKCDVEENEMLAMEFGIRNIPTIIFFSKGEMVEKVLGAQSESVLDEKFQRLLL
jgi:thioredoxin 1